MKVDFVTLGGASERIDVPSPTLRNWTDQLEEYGVHFTKRNNRNERIYFKEDLDIFEYVRDMKSEYGRKTTTKDLAKMIANDPRFELRSRENAPSPVEEPSNRLDLLNQEDIKDLMGSERVMQFMNIIVEQTTKNIKDDLIKEVTESVESISRDFKKRNLKLEHKLETMEREQKEALKSIQENNKELIKKLEETQKQSEKKGFWSNLFG